jgi:hypothetical protein
VDLEIEGGCDVEGGGGETCPIRRGKENATHVLFNCPEIRIGREIFLEKKWPVIKEETAFKKNYGVHQNYRIQKFRNIFIQG